MTIGTRSVLFGAHAFWLHPWFVAWSWARLYGFSYDPRLWLAFFLHDLGYWGKPNMDGLEGEEHPFLGARIMSALFDRRAGKHIYNIGKRPKDTREREYALGPWGEFALFHSRFLSKRCQEPFSRLCVADKLAFALTPRWLYLPMVRATGEIKEYMKLAEERTGAGEPKFAAQGQHHGDEETWFEQVKTYMTRWVDEHSDMREDTWTPSTKEAITKSGVWR